MPKFDVAHIREQGIDVIIVPLNSSFRFKNEFFRSINLQFVAANINRQLYW